MEGQSRVERLDGSPLVKADPGSWPGCFVGSITIENVQEEGDAVHFDVILPTGETDINDFIWLDERKRGTTDKVRLMQGGSAVVAARVVGIEREGPDTRWRNARSDQYRVTFEVPTSAIRGREPLEVHLRWGGSNGGEWIEVAKAVASGIA
jgi:hypothetical protein